eukprot:3884124-Alexandrium_andersonii.AAC.1
MLALLYRGRSACSCWGASRRERAARRHPPSPAVCRRGSRARADACRSPEHALSGAPGCEASSTHAPPTGPASRRANWAQTSPGGRRTGVRPEVSLAGATHTIPGFAPGGRTLSARTAGACCPAHARPCGAVFLAPPRRP